jgi:hypothetical protein
VLALDAIGSTPPSTESPNSATGERAFVVRHAAFVAQYRWALELLDRLDRDPGLVSLLDEAIPELGLPTGTYGRLRFRFLNVLRATEFAALGGLREADARGVNRVMSDPLEVRHRLRGHRHVDQEPHPVSSMVSSSARLAA